MISTLVHKRSATWLQISRSAARRGGSNVNVIHLPPFERETPKGRCGTTNPDPPCIPRTDIKGPRCETTTDYEPCIPVPLENSMWESGSCCDHPCPNMLPRFDQLYYKRSDKAKRRYHQTWVECPEPVKKTVVRCCHDPEALPPIERRERKERPNTACNMMERDCTLHKQSKCLKIVMPGCRSSRATTFHCLVDKNPSSGCPHRECAPYPSFSECVRQRPDPLPKSECNCFFDPMQCELNKEFERWLWNKLKNNN